MLFTRTRVRQKLWGRLATCGGLITRPNTPYTGQQAPVDNRRAGYHPAPQLMQLARFCEKYVALGKIACPTKQSSFRPHTTNVSARPAGPHRSRPISRALSFEPATGTDRAAPLSPSGSARSAGAPAGPRSGGPVFRSCARSDAVSTQFAPSCLCSLRRHRNTAGLGARPLLLSCSSLE